MDTIQTPGGLIHIHTPQNWRPKPKVVLSEAGDATKSMVMWLILTRIWMTILELIWERLCNEYAIWCSINLFRSIKSLLYYHWMNNDQLWSNLRPRVWPHNIKPLPRGTLLTTVEQPDLVPSWSRCWPQKAWCWSTDTIQALVGLIHIHIMHNWGPRPKVILSEAGDTARLAKKYGPTKN